MQARLFLFLMLFSTAAFSVTGCPSVADCPGCQELQDAIQAKMFLSVDSSAYKVTATLYYESLNASPPRQPIANSTVIINVYNDSFSEIYRIYTDTQGVATFDFSSYKDRCVNFKFLYCPFTCLNSSQCGFANCLNFSGMDCPPGTCNATDITNAPDATPPTALNCPNLLPTISIANYCPPPPPLSATPLICLPLLLIFAVLGGALFLSGRNPFVGFDFTAPRIGRHVRYQARGRGFAIDTMTVAMSIKGAVSTIKKMRATSKEVAKMKKEGKSPEAIAKYKKKHAAERPTYMFGTAITDLVRGAPGGVQMVAGKVYAGARGKGIKGEWKSFVGAMKGAGKGVSGKVFTANIVRTVGGLVDRSRLGYIFGANLTGTLMGALNRVWDTSVIDAKQMQGSALQELNKYGSKVSRSFEGIEIVRTEAGEKGIIEVAVKGKKAVAELDMTSLSNGVLNGTITLGGNKYTIENGGIASVVNASTGLALGKGDMNAAIKGLDMKSFSQELGKNITMKTRMYSEELNKPVTVVTNPLSKSKDFVAIIPGSKGDENGIHIKVNNEGETYSIKDYSKPSGQQDMPDIKGTDVKVGSDFSGMRSRAIEANAAYNDVRAAEQAVKQAERIQLGRQYAEANPALAKQLSDAARAYAKTKVGSEQANEIFRQADHVGFEQDASGKAHIAATDDGLRALAKQPSIKKQNPKAYKAISQYVGATTMPKEGGPVMPKEDAYVRFITPVSREVDSVIERNKDTFKSAYQPTYEKNYISGIKRNYGQMTSDPKLRKELELNAPRMLGDFYQKTSGIPPDIARQLSRGGVSRLLDESGNVSKQAVHSMIGNAIADSAGTYKAKRENPYGYSAKQLFLGSIEPATSLKAFERQTKDIATLELYAPKLPKKRQAEMYYKAMYNLPQAAKEAAKLARKRRSKK